MSAIFKREFRAYFQSPMGFIFLAVMFAAGGLGFVSVIGSGVAEIQYMFSSFMSALMFVLPLITMRLLSDERRQKTDQLLLTSPVSIGGLIWGKYLAALCVFLIGVSVSFIFMLILATFTPPNWNIFVGNILGITLFGASLLAIGIFISSLTESQIIAAVVTYATLIGISMTDMIAQNFSTSMPVLSQVLQQISFFGRCYNLMGGTLELISILFFVSLIVVFNFLAMRMVERQRWS